MAAADEDLEPSARRGARDRKALLLRLDPAVHEALTRWADDELRSLNGHIEWLLRQALGSAGRMPADARTPRRPGRPSAAEAD